METERWPPRSSEDQEPDQSRLLLFSGRLLRFEAHCSNDGGLQRRRDMISARFRSDSFMCRFDAT
jgi:hypothetical protein